MDEAMKISLLKDEYVLLQNFYEEFDRRLLTIKGWSVTVALGAIGVGFYQSEYLWLFAVGASIAFWLLEALWKSFQYMHAQRIAVLEKAFSKGEFENIKPLQIYNSWFEVQDKYGLRIWRHFGMGIVALPHLLTFVIGILLFVLQILGVPLVQ